MSLIHDALKSMDSEAPQPPRPSSSARAPAAAPRRGRPAWLDGLLAFCVVVGAGVVGWQVWQGRLLQSEHPPVQGAVAGANTPVQPAQVSVPGSGAEVAKEPDAGPAAAAARVPASPVAPAPDVAPASEPTVAVATAAQPQVPSVAPVPANTAVATHGSSAVRPRAASASHPVRTARRAAPAAVAPTSTVVPKVDDTPVQVRFTRFVAAMRAGQTADAERELTALKAVLPSDALGLLRAQAWFDLRGGRPEAAAKGYRQILERLPGDEEAAVNLASIQVGQSDQEGARATLDTAARLNPDSKALRAALAQYTPNARK